MGSKNNGTTTPDFTQGTAGAGSGTQNFTLPDGVGSASGGPQPLAGLTGVQSGLSSASQAQALAPQPVLGQAGYQFTVPSAAGGNLSAAAQTGLGMGAKLATPPSTGQTTQSRGGAPRLQATQFSSGLSDAITNSGSTAGNGLIQLLQKLVPGTV